MFLVNTGICPSLEKKSPRPTSFSLTTFGSNWICKGEEATSAAFSMTSAIVMDEPTVVFTTGGRKWTDALPVGRAASGLAGAVDGGPAGVGGAAGGVSGGAVAGGRLGEPGRGSAG